MGTITEVKGHYSGGNPHGSVAKQPHLDVRVNPAIGLSIHGLRTECGSHQEDILAREGSLARELSTFKISPLVTMVTNNMTTGNMVKATEVAKDYPQQCIIQVLLNAAGYNILTSWMSVR